MGTRRRAPSVVAAVEAELAALPEPLRTSAAAVSALGIAHSLDRLDAAVLFRFQAGLVRELRECMTELAARASAPGRAPSPSESEESSPVADLTAKIAAKGRPGRA